MQDVFTLVGVVCALLICGTIFVAALGARNRAREDSYYQGLQEQLSDTINNIAEHYAKDGMIRAGSVRQILSTLKARRWPNIADIKANDEYAAQLETSNVKCGTYSMGCFPS